MAILCRPFSTQRRRRKDFGGAVRDQTNGHLTLLNNINSTYIYIYVEYTYAIGALGMEVTDVRCH